MANNVYDLPSTKKSYAYHHASAGFPTKAKRLKAIKAGFYAAWPMLMTATVKKHFPKSRETQKDHMQQSFQRV